MSNDSICIDFYKMLTRKFFQNFATALVKGNPLPEKCCVAVDVQLVGPQPDGGQQRLLLRLPILLGCIHLQGSKVGNKNNKNPTTCR